MEPTANPGSTPSVREVVRRGFRSFQSFCGLLLVVDKTGHKVPFRLNRTQRKWVAGHTARDVRLKSRQVGLTTVAVAWMVWRFLTVKGARVRIVCQSQSEDNNVKELSRTVETYLQALERFVSLSFRTRSTTVWELEGRDAVLEIITAGASADSADKKGRGGRTTHLLMTEAAYYEYAENTFRAILNTVPSEEQGSEVIIECTAKGAHGAFYEYCDQARKGDGAFSFEFYPWYSHEEYETPVLEGEEVRPKTPLQRLLVERHGVTPPQLKWWQGKVAEARGDEDFVNQEYPSDPDTCFLAAGRGFFDTNRLLELLREASEPPIKQRIRETGFLEMRDGREFVPGLRVWHPPAEGERYVVVCDTSEGDGGSAGCAGVFEFRTGRHMATLWGQIKPWVLAAWAVRIARKYNGALIAVERNNHGGTVLRAIFAEQRYPRARVFHDRDGKPGWNNGPTVRAPALDTFEEAVRDGYFKTNDSRMIGEMRTFVVILKGMSERAQHAKGKRDDLVIMGAIAWDVLTRPQPRRKKWVDALPAA